MSELNELQKIIRRGLACRHCLGDEGIHRASDMACPQDGREWSLWKETPAVWLETKFEKLDPVEYYAEDSWKLLQKFVEYLDGCPERGWFYTLEKEAKELYKKIGVEYP